MHVQLLVDPGRATEGIVSKLIMIEMETQILTCVIPSNIRAIQPDTHCFVIEALDILDDRSEFSDFATWLYHFRSPVLNHMRNVAALSAKS